MMRRRPAGVTAVAILMIVFGLAEVTMGFTHRFLGLSTSPDAISTWAGSAIGVCYAVAGVLVLSMRKRAAGVAIVLLVADVLGRIGMVVLGLYPLDSVRQIAAVSVGTAVVAVFGVYIGLNWAAFR